MIDVDRKTSFPNHGLCLESLCLVGQCGIDCMFDPNVAAAPAFLTAAQVYGSLVVKIRHGKHNNEDKLLFQRYQARR